MFAVQPNERKVILTKTRNLKMARSPHAYVRGNTVKFYELLARLQPGSMPEGPPIWICGDCHVGNLGPVANARGRIEVQIRDLDHTVIGNPAHDLIRLGLSLASAARGSDLPGVTTARMIEAMMEGYEQAFVRLEAQNICADETPAIVKRIVRESGRRKWKDLARERIKDPSPVIPLGKKFWVLDEGERSEIAALFAKPQIKRLATMLRGRDDDAKVKVVDAAFWLKGCSSLGLLRYAILLAIGEGADRSYCLMDIKEAIAAAAPAYPAREMPENNAERVEVGARALSPYLGDRLRAGEMAGKSIFVRELLPQDLKIEVEYLTEDEAIKTAFFLANVVGRAHAGQMSVGDAAEWWSDLQKNRSKSLDAPSWLWSSIVSLLMSHEGGYLEHCRRFALEV